MLLHKMPGLRFSSAGRDRGDGHPILAQGQTVGTRPRTPDEYQGGLGRNYVG
jgi:hypothetical protein